MAELERPSDDGKDVQDRTRPKNKDDEETGQNVGPEHNLACRDRFTGTFNLKCQGNTLNNADQRELDLADHGIELGTRGGGVHGCPSLWEVRRAWKAASIFNALGESSILNAACANTSSAFPELVARSRIGRDLELRLRPVGPKHRGVGQMH